MDNLIRTLAIWPLPVIFAITLNEAAHGYVAWRFGNLTAHAQRRISLNPARYVDPVGTLIVPLLTLAIVGFFFGWGKPAQSRFRRCAIPSATWCGWLQVAAAGPTSNLAMAIAWGCSTS